MPQGPGERSWLSLLNTGFLVVQASIGGYLVAVPDRTSFVTMQILVLVHVVTCILWLPLFLWWVARHAWTQLVASQVRVALTSRRGLLGIVLLTTVALGFGSGFPLLGKGAGMPLATFHAVAGLALLLPFGMHLWMEQRRLLLGGVVALGLAGLASIFTVKESVASDTLYPATPDFTYRNQPLEAYDSASWCGSCHVQVYDEWRTTSHRRTIHSKKVRDAFADEEKLNARASTVTMTEWGKMVEGDPDLSKDLPTKSPFLSCAACHAPLGFYAGTGQTPVGAPEPVGDGITCAFCHTLRGFGGGHMDLAGVFEGVARTGLFDNHTLIKEIPFYVSGPRTVRRYLWQNDRRPILRWVGDMLIRWRPEMHARDYHPDFLNSSLVCHGCHGFQGSMKLAPGRSYDTWANGPYNASDPAKRTECQDCHMARSPDGHPVREQGRLVPWAPERPQRRLHYFLGGNVEFADPDDRTYIQLQRELRAKGVELTVGAARIEDGTLLVDVSLHNRMNAHFFPAYETKRRFAWVDLTVVDSRGQEVARSRPAPTALGDLVGCCKPGMDPIVYFRVISDSVQLVADSLVPPDGTRRDTARLTLSSDAVFPLRAIATLHHNLDAEPVVSAQTTLERPHVVHPVVQPAQEQADVQTTDDAPVECDAPPPSDALAPVTLPGGVQLEMVRIPAGAFWMGSPDSEVGRWPDEHRQRKSIDRDFLLGKYAVTQAQWRAVMGSDPSRFSACGASCPVEQVSWHDCRAFAQRLNQLVACGFRLPSEAEWEYACRAGRDGPSDGTALGDVAWFADNAGQGTHPVGQKQPNGLGLYDMLGNVWQWCEDRHTLDPRDPGVDPGRPLTGANRMVRGGSFGDNARSARCAARDNDGPDVRLELYGCRVARSL